MILTPSHSLLIIVLCGLCTFALRLLPFSLFGRREVPPLIVYLGKILPMAVIAALVVYCLRGMDFTSASGFVPEIVASLLTAALHLFKRNTLLSVLGGTVTYMLLIQLVF